jgi:hypothetical protein
VDTSASQRQARTLRVRTVASPCLAAAATFALLGALAPAAPANQPRAAAGGVRLGHGLAPGAYYAMTPSQLEPGIAECAAARSGTIRKRQPGR